MSEDPAELYFREAYRLARECLAENEVPVGAVIVRNGEIIGRGRNRIVDEHDATSHAEMIALKEAFRTTGNERLTDCDLYTTLEPCLMCSGALILSRVKFVHFLAADEKLPGLRTAAGLPGINHTILWRQYDIPELDSAALLRSFFRSRRG